MLNAKAIAEHFHEKGIELASSVFRDPERPEQFLVFVKISRDSRGRQRPSKHQLALSIQHLQESGAQVDLVLVSDEGRDIVASVKTALEVRFADTITNVFFNQQMGNLVVWIEPKKLLQAAEEKAIDELVRRILKALGVQTGNIYFTNSANLPTPTAVLNSIRILAPVGFEELIKSLRSREFDVPNEEWLNRMLDRLRKSQRIIRLSESKKFALTKTGLALLGSKKSRRSPDIVRALALSRRED